jgi:hypothetical protein
VIARSTNCPAGRTNWAGIRRYFTEHRAEQIGKLQSISNKWQVEDLVLKRVPTERLRAGMFVQAFFSLRSNMHIRPVQTAVEMKSAADHIVGIEDPAEHGLSRVDEIWSKASTPAQGCSAGDPMIPLAGVEFPPKNWSDTGRYPA